MRTILTAFILFVVFTPLSSTTPAGAEDAIAPLAATISRESQVSFNFSLEPIQTFPGDNSVNLKSALRTRLRLLAPGFVIVNTSANEVDLNNGTICEISIGVAPGSTPNQFTEIPGPAARKGYRSQDTVVSNIYVVGPLSSGTYWFHFLFKSNNFGGVCTLGHRTIVAEYVPRNANGDRVNP